MAEPSRSRQTALGVSLAIAIVGGWLALHVYGVFFYRLTGWSWLAIAPMIAVQSWLGAGMFIVAHDAIHGSLAVGRPRLNAVIGQVAVGLYAGFAYGKLKTKHHEHHRAPGTAQDPDFHVDRPRAFTAWYVRFFRTYFGWAEFARISGALFIYLVILRASPLNAGLFWGVPAILSSLQLFTFGTWLPHRHADDFADRHRARSLDYPWVLSLLACFHFGRHHEHHLHPGAPWWRLPAMTRG